MSVLPAGSTIGIIGGGQLGRMLAMAASRFSYKTIVLDPSADCPAAQLCSDHIIAAYDDQAALAGLAARADVITYEFENVPVAPLQALGATPLAPSAKALEVAQDRLVEKDFLNAHDIATAPYRDITSIDDLGHALEAFGGKGILKTRRLGYDGKGQIRLINADAQTQQAALDSLKGANAILEGFVDFTAEISVIAARGMDGHVATFPPAKNVHEDGILATSTVPSNVPDATIKAAQDATKRLANALGYVGVMGVEFFALDDGTLLANEFAPRVHNSGHWTEAACAISQFEMHIRAITGHALPTPQLHTPCVMHNLIGDQLSQLETLAADPNTHIHLYGKAETRQGRKMGHVTRLLPPNA